MNIEKAKEILAYNKLDLSMAGIDYIPVKTVNIERFEIMNKSNNEDTNWSERAYLLGLVKNNNRKDYGMDGELTCCSFMVKLGLDYYYREHFNGAMEVIEALRTVNNYKDLFPDDSFTRTF